MIKRAERFDLPQVAAIYRRAFPDSITHIFGKTPKDKAFIDIYQFLLDTYPEYFLVDEEDGRITGYVVAPPDVSILVKRAILRGYVLRWSWRWLIGKYGFGLRPVWILLGDKWALLRSKHKAVEESDARILSIAVDPAYQGRGIGGKLTKAALDLLRASGIEKVMLEVREGNEAAYRIYTKFGFREVGKFRDSGGVWIQMVADLPKKAKAA
ncbi:MAG: GNAT family N-acetyltransferase [Actinobacteria bacterium]|nr:GNAT family N-acetyltransferase [Actinomycetota bacterium]